MSFRIYRLAEKEAKQGGSERGFAQTITRPGGQGAWIGDEASSRRSERTQEFEEGLLFRGFQLSEFFGDVSGLAAVAEDGVEKSDGSAVVHETRMQADAPKRGGADFVCGVVEFGDGEVSPGDLVHVLAIVLGHGHDDAVAGADIVEQEVAVGMKLLFPERRWDGESAAVDSCAGRSGGERLDVTNIAADPIKKFSAQSRFGSLRNVGVAPGRFAGAHEARETIDVREAVGTRRVVGLGGGIAKIGDFVGLETIGNAHFIKIGITGKRQQAGVLVFPAETADAGLTRCFQDGNVEYLAANLVAVFPALVLGEVNKGPIGDSFHESIAENVQRNAEGANILRIWNAFLNLRAGEGRVRADGAVVHQGAVLDDFGAAGDGDLGALKFATGAAVTDAQFRNLAGAAGRGILVTLAARLRVVERAQTIGDLFDFVELDLIRRMRGVVHQAIAFVTEAGRRFRKHSSEGEKRNRQHRQTKKDFHEYLGRLEPKIYRDML